MRAGDTNGMRGTSLRPGRQPPLRGRLREIMEPYAGGPEATWLSLATDLLQEDDPWGQSVLTALQGHLEQALEHVCEAVTRLPGSADWLRRDPDLGSLHADERFWLLLVAGRKP